MIQADILSDAPDFGQNDPTVFGLTPTQLHDRFWAARGVQVVRQGEPSQIVRHAELYLLADPRTLTIFKLSTLLDMLAWVAPDVLFIRLHETVEHGYRERVVSDAAGRFVRFERIYGGGDSRLARVALTTDREIAMLWQSEPDPRTGWRRLRHTVHRRYRATVSINGRVYDRAIRHERMQFVRELVARWRRPDATIRRAYRASNQTWIDAEGGAPQQTRFIGPVWVGAGRKLNADDSVVGPAALWDKPENRPAPDDLQWLDIERTDSFETPRPRVRSRSGFERLSKRLFDIVFSLLAMLLMLPIYPIIMLAIFIEDGRPFFFGHKRETIGGREFRCFKFRSMRKDAEKIKAQLVAANRADGPQFFLDDDPRLTRVGKLIRKLNIDELPQFVNVLLGHMSIVGPRPSPFSENQFCPGWREARLSVRPGITGLWQVRRSRLSGLDFQEWIRYDIEYVEKGNWAMDIWIIGQTFAVILRGAFSRANR